MANMSYCRFENTLIDLQDCLDALNDRNISNDRERRKAGTLLKTMAEFLVSEGLIYVDYVDYVDYEPVVYIDNNAIDEFVNECKDQDKEDD